MKKSTFSEAPYATIAYKGMVLVPLKLDVFPILDLFLQPR